MTDFDVVVAGGGAAGLFAAAAAAERGARTLLLEKNRRAGVKVLASGGTRCNVAPALPTHRVIAAFPREQTRFLGPALKRLGPDEVIAQLATSGVPTRVEKYEKHFPESGRATDVLAAFMRRLERSGATLHGERPLTALVREQDGTFTCATPHGSVRARRVILATGGRSYPKTGTTGDGYPIAAALGHSILPPRPALVPLSIPVPWVTALSGITIEPVTTRVVDRSGNVLAMRADRPLLFTHAGLSGPAAMDVSRAASDDPAARQLEVDFLPETGEPELLARCLAAFAANPAKTAANALDVALPQRLVEALLAAAGIDAERRAAEVSRKSLPAFVRRVKSCRLDLAGTLGFDHAEVTAGGVALEEVDASTMESRRCPGLFVCGEVLDVDGPIGGFNFQAAFATGTLAGEAAARGVR